jgi:hypothetical protein
VSGERQRFPSPDGRDAPPELVKKKKLNAWLDCMALLYPASPQLARQVFGKREKGNTGARENGGQARG